MSDTTTEAATGTTAATGPSRGATIGVWVLQVLAGAMFIFAGFSKLSGDPMQVESFNSMGLGVTGMYVIGVLEIAGGVGVLLPGVAGFAAVCLVALMIGAVAITAGMMGFTPLIAIPVVTLIIVAVIAWVRRRNAAAFLRFILGR